MNNGKKLKNAKKIKMILYKGVSILKMDILKYVQFQKICQTIFIKKDLIYIIKTI